MGQILLTETLSIAHQGKNHVSFNVVEILGESKSAAVRGVFNQTNVQENPFYRNGNRIVCFATIDDYVQYERESEDIKDDIAAWNKAMKQKEVERETYDNHIREVWIPMTRAFIAKWKDLVLPDIRYSLRTFEFEYDMDLTHWPGLNEVAWRWFVDA